MDKEASVYSVRFHEDIHAFLYQGSEIEVLDGCASEVSDILRRKERVCRLALICLQVADGRKQSLFRDTKWRLNA
jgi:hypothetical protein